MAYDAIPESESRHAPLLGSGDDGARQLVNWLFPIYTLMLVLGIFALQAKGVLTGTGQGMNIPQSIVTAVDSATLTGFRHTDSVVPRPADIELRGQVVIVALNVVGSLFALVVGGLAVARILRLPFKPRQIILAALLFEAGAAAIGGIALREPSGSFGPGLLVGISRGVGAFGNYGSSLATTPLGLLDWQTHVIILPLVVLGGLGITVLLELTALGSRRRLSQHARTVLSWTFALYVIGTIVFAAMQWAAAHYTRDPDKMRTLWANSSLMAIVTRTAGISERFGYAFPRAMEWVIMALMLIGANPGGTGGGIKTTTFAAIGGGARRLLRGQNPGRPLGIALSWVGLYLGMLLGGVIALLYTEPQSGADRVLMLVISALGNVGLSHDRLSMTIPGMFILSALMLAGRMVPLLILWWMADTTADAELAVG